jgi:hypothetical protein
VTSSNSNPSRIDELNRVSLQLGNWDKPALFISAAFVVFLDFFKMFAAIPSALHLLASALPMVNIDRRTSVQNSRRN